MNEEIPKKIRWNAIASYGLIFASLAFLISKDPKYSHPFVRSHTKVAFILHSLLLFMLFIMSYPFLKTIKIYTLSLNDIITAILGLIIFWGIAYGASKAHKGETVTLWEMLTKATKKEWFTSHIQLASIDEYDSSLLIIGHIPFLGFILAAQNSENKDLRDISLLSLWVTLFCLLLVYFKFVNIAAIFFLIYIIWSLFVSIRLLTTKELTRLNLSIIPTPSEWYILLQALWVYIKNIFDKNIFIELRILRKKYEEIHTEKQEKNETLLKKQETFQYSPLLISIPLINFIGVFYRHTQERQRIYNGIILSIVLIWVYLLYWAQSPIFLLALIPFCYHAGYVDKKAYHMPIISDVVRILTYISEKVWHIWKKTRELQKKEIKGSFKSEVKNEQKNNPI